MRKDAYIELARRANNTRYVNLGSTAALFNEAAHPRAKAGASGGTGGQFVKAGKARDSKAAEAQKDKGAEKNSEGIQTGKVDPSKLNDTDLQALTKYLYSFKSSDPQIVKARIQVAGQLAKRGMNVNDFGGLGKKTPAKPAAKAGAVAGAKAGSAKPAAKKTAAAPAKKKS